MADPTGLNLTAAEVLFADGSDPVRKRLRLAERMQALRTDLDSQIADYKASCRAATDAALPACTYANGVLGAGATLTGNAFGALAAQDGVTLLVDERLLVKDQVAGLQNGIYELTQVGTAGTPFILTRAADANLAALLSPGFIVHIEEGTANADSAWLHSTNAPIVVGTTALTFSRESVDWTSVSAALAAATSRADFNEQHILSGGLELEAGADLTIAVGAIVPTHGQHRVDTEAAAAADDLDTITATNFVDGGMLFLQGTTLGQIVRLRHGVGNILGPAGSNIEIGVTASDWALLFYDGTNWHVVAHSRGGVRFGTSEDALTIAVGSITATGVGLVSVDTEAAAARDDLDTIVATNYLPGQCIVLRPTTVSQVSVLTAAGNIDLPGGYEIEVGNSIDDRVFLMWDGTAWQVLAVACSAHATPKHNLSAVVAPAVGNDDTESYAVGSLWFDTVLSVFWRCSNASTGAAVWLQISDVAATEALAGRIELATQGEVDTGTDDVRAVTPLKHTAFAGTFTGVRSQKVHAAFTGSARVETTAAVETTDATVTTLWNLTLADDTAYWVEADIIARSVAGTTAENSYKIRAMVHRRAAGAATLGAAGTVTLYIDEEDLDWAAVFDVNVNDVRLRVTGDAAATSLAWAATIRYQAVGGVA